jgi:hypothetical protein
MRGAVMYAPGDVRVEQGGGAILNTSSGAGVKRDGGIKPGDRIYFEAGENDWHGAVPNRFMTHIAMQEADDSAGGRVVVWGEHVTDEQYNAAPTS